MAEFVPTVQNTLPEGVDVTHVARMWKADGSAFLRADFSSPATYDVEVFDLEDGSLILNETGTAISQVAEDPVFVALTVDGYWQGKDATGYSFRHTLTQAELTSAGLGGPFAGGKKYRTVYTLNSDSDGDVVLIFEDTVVSVRPI